MATIKELKLRIRGITEMRKITNAMYMIASVKLRHAKEELEKTRPFFNNLRTQTQRVFRADATEKSQYFYPSFGKRDDETTVGFLVITSDKGLSGTYSRDVIKEALARSVPEKCDADSTKIFIVGEYGRQYFRGRNLPFAEDFDFPAASPNFHRARRMAHDLLARYDSGEIDELRVLYTDYENGLSTHVKEARILPFERKSFIDGAEDEVEFEYLPSISNVLETAVAGYLTGYIFSAMVDSYCSEQSMRMAAMDVANRNASELLDELKLQYNHARQSAITAEVTEISAGYRNRRKEPPQS
ncbi:MAG: ATP synthase F1 subunit gamma [Clostridia bacterium]|nr:ATP synthase F1 subunit gamma [Clostridia bacterium]